MLGGNAMQHRLDNIARSLATGQPRRALLKTLLVAPFTAMSAHFAGWRSEAWLTASGVSANQPSTTSSTVGVDTFEVVPYRAPGYRFLFIPTHKTPPVGFETD